MITKEKRAKIFLHKSQFCGHGGIGRRARIRFTRSTNVCPTQAYAVSDRREPEYYRINYGNLAEGFISVYLREIYSFATVGVK
ncbi:hypothetical protein [Brevibacillus laterosporus]|uniref:hypothetical protein n=1 Tax=Brevibacillus laterosporus TaxID=1465 RepID=UPI0018F8B0F6|nr:hypothetical protein [Brevibacillus laterosporus]